jgi:Splicing factor
MLCAHIFQNNNLPGMDLTGEIWVETKANEGKSYFYNARTRETTWTKPEGPAVKIITQEQVLMSLEVSVAEYWTFVVFCDVMLLPSTPSLGPNINCEIHDGCELRNTAN